MERLRVEEVRAFQKAIWQYYKKHGRKMPWRNTHDPYKILISEVMLQQTQVSRVVPKYTLFIKKFPNVRALSNASISEVLRAWLGLGYNRRALSLQKLSTIVMQKHGGKVPQSREELTALPGIGEGTAGAIRAFAFNLPVVFIETNIRRVYIGSLFKGKKRVHDKDILVRVQETLDHKNPREWYYALMDYGAMLKTKEGNPNKKSAHYHVQGKFAGSQRELRGKVVRLLLENDKTFTQKTMAKSLSESVERIRAIVSELRREEFIEIRGGQQVRLKN